MVQVDVFWSYGIGAGLGLASAARGVMRKEAERAEEIASPLQALRSPDAFQALLFLLVVFRELIDNARSHAPRPGVACQVTISGSVDSEGVCYQVVDDGGGMNADERSRTKGLFRGSRDGVAGVGMGLAVAERAMTRMGGQLILGVAPGGGTRVCLRFPAVGRS